MAIPQELKWLTDAFFLAHSDEYDLSTQEGCGKYTEALVEEAQNKGFKRVGHLKKHGGQTQYNGHAIDAILYKEASGPEGLYQAIDLIGGAESNHAVANFGVDIPRYTDADWIAKPNGSNPNPTPLPVPTFPGYEELGGDNVFRSKLGKVLEFDYKRANHLMNDGTVVWTSRTLYDAFADILLHGMKADVAVLRSIDKHRSEWCLELGVPVVDFNG